MQLLMKTESIGAFILQIIYALIFQITDYYEPITHVRGNKRVFCTYSLLHPKLSVSLSVLPSLCIMYYCISFSAINKVSLGIVAFCNVMYC